MAPALTKYPHEARVQRFAYMALAGATLLAVFLAQRSPGAVLGMTVPFLVMFALVALGAVVGIVAVVRRSAAIALGAGALLALGVVPGGFLEPGILGYGAGLLIGALILGFGELVHMTQRYDRAHQLIDEEGVSEDSLDRVTDEALKTLWQRTGLALGLALAPVILVLLLAAFGPQAWREGLETAAPLGVAVVALTMFVAIAIFILTRGATLSEENDQEPEAVAVAEVQLG
ncbi:MAG: hypothetical protein WDA16_12320 [Candidatus Thermoplasmatota archaeon]